ncbi:expressed unknown protein [Seminavis robusta]|uniref:tRNA-uridine aminocarboxypropyltransferase n=1 Tax=Seminavis robusta TaxID=568900 RepID=A0A9N8DLM8_9STRA|nr:expressed unknown protein [Seminavis robusta]|eukprot:Sro147_g067890.1 n/a (354) ;mRNA; r:61755-62816
MTDSPSLASASEPSEGMACPNNNSKQDHHELDTNSNNHAVQWERQGEWLVKLRAHKTKLVQEQGLQGLELWEAMATLSLNHKIASFKTRNNRCAHCWHDERYCMCARLSKPDYLQQHQCKIKLCLLMHHKEYFCAGNSAKILLHLFPEMTELYLYGKTGEFDRLVEEITQWSTRTMILWPGADALSVPEFLARQDIGGQSKSHQEDTTATIRVVVLDATYSQARNMYKALSKRLENTKREGRETIIPTVAVNPLTSSVFHRAQKNYGQAHKQRQKSDSNNEQQNDDSTNKKQFATRISTAEACGWLLFELGFPQSVPDAIIRAVKLNNDALAYARKRQQHYGADDDVDPKQDG